MNPPPTSLPITSNARFSTVQDFFQWNPQVGTSSSSTSLQKGYCTTFYVYSVSSVLSDSVTQQTIAGQASLSMGFPRQEDWSGLPCPSPGDLPHQGIELASPVLVGGFFTPESAGKPAKFYTKEIFYQAFCRGTSFSEATL